MSLKIWIDGQLVDKSEAKLSVYDHGLLYGDGVFEGIRVYSGKIFECEAHLDRLWNSAKALRLQIPVTRDEITKAMYETVKVNNFTDCYIRLVVTRGVGDLGLDPKKCSKPTVFIISDLIAVYPKEMYDKGIAVITASVIRNHPNALSARVKSLNYLNNILAKIEANDAGVPEAIMLNHEGNVAECTADNLFVVREGVVYTPTTYDGILEGVTRRVIIQLCAQLGIPLVEKTLQRHDIYIAEEMFLSGTGAEVIAVTKVDGRPIGAGQAGPLTRGVMEAFHKHVRASK
jgi:branched-chain amino acid aminotransferase